MLVIDYLWPFYSVGFLKIIHLCGNDYMSQHPLFSKALNCLGGYKNGNQFYQYGYLGLTNWKQRAMAYAYNAYAGGELGLVAYELYHAAERIGFDGWKPEGAVESAAGEIVDFAEGKHEPILFAINDYDIRLLQTENGKVVPDDLLEMLADGSIKESFRYTGNLSFDLGHAEITALHPHGQEQTDGGGGAM